MPFSFGREYHEAIEVDGGTLAFLYCCLEMPELRGRNCSTLKKMKMSLSHMADKRKRKGKRKKGGFLGEEISL